MAQLFGGEMAARLEQLRTASAVESGLTTVPIDEQDSTLADESDSDDGTDDDDDDRARSSSAAAD
jgi:hypothetical protein